MQRKGCSLSPEQFQERVNVIFHDHEAHLYDEMHADMKHSLQEQVDLLVNDLLKTNNVTGKKLNVLDVGCGTGLSTEFLLNTDLNPQINRVTLLDTSEKMLQYAEQKAKTWNREYRIENGNIADIKEKFDVVLVCSVLHHIPNLKAFLMCVEKVLNSGGFFIHLQDPNEDYLDDVDYLERLSSFTPKSVSRLNRKEWATYVPKEIRFKIKRLLGRKNYIDLINDQLIREKIVKERMTAEEIWSVTDIHVSATKGISFKFLDNSLRNFTLVNRRSYGFYGKLKSELSEKLKSQEEKFILQNCLDGRNISAIWIKN